VKTQHLTLTKKLQGHSAYYGITSNHRALDHLLDRVERVWYRALARRSQRWPSWRAMKRLVARFSLPAARVVHQYGTQRILPL
jgi:RNA-directed DNA polymerase